MKISGVEVFAVALPWRRRHPTASGTDVLGRYVIVQLHTDEGITGLGEATVLVEWGGDYGRYFGESPGTTIHVVRDILGPVITWMDPTAIEAVHAQMNRTIKGYPYAKTAIDLALHDIKGKALGVPVYQLLGGLYRREIPIAHSLGILELDTMLEEATTAVAEGIKTIKIKIGLEPERDVKVVREVRRAVGPRVDIVVDGNQGYATPKLAIQTLRRMEEYQIRYAEQPVEGLDRMAQVAAGVDVPIMADESAWSSYDILDIIKLKAADMISLYTTKPGGLYPAKKAAAVAEAGGYPCNVNGSAETGVGNVGNLHLVASTRIISEACVVPITTLAGREQTKIAGKFYTDDIVTEPFLYQDGCLVVPDKPGLGVELDPAKVAKYRVG